MSEVEDWDEAAGGNTDPTPNGFPEGMPPSGVNDSMREVMASVKRFYLSLTDPLSLTPIVSAFSDLANRAKTLLHSVDPALPDATPLEEDDGDWYLDRENHHGLIHGNEISPQPNDNIGPNAGLGLNAATLQGLTAAQVAAGPKNIRAPAWMNNLGDDNTNFVAGAGTTNIQAGVRYYNNFTVGGGRTLRLTQHRQYIIFVRGTCTIAGTIDASGRGGLGGPLGSSPASDGAGGPNYLGGNGGSGWDGNDGLGGATRWNGQPPQNANGGNAATANHEHFALLNFWSEDYEGGSGGGGSSSGAQSSGGDGGGIVMIVANNFNFTGQINCRGRENLSGGDNDLHDAGVGGGGIIVTGAVNTISNSGSRLINGPIPAGFGNIDTTIGGNGWEKHLDLSA